MRLTSSRVGDVVWEDAAQNDMARDALISFRDVSRGEFVFEKNNFSGLLRGAGGEPSSEFLD